MATVTINFGRFLSGTWRAQLGNCIEHDQQLVYVFLWYSQKKRSKRRIVCLSFLKGKKRKLKRQSDAKSNERSGAAVWLLLEMEMEMERKPEFLTNEKPYEIRKKTLLLANNIREQNWHLPNYRVWRPWCKKLTSLFRKSKTTNKFNKETLLDVYRLTRL